MKNILIFCALSLPLMFSCSNPVEEYIHNELPENIWRIQIKSMIEEESSRVLSVLNSAAADSISMTNKRIASIQAEGREYCYRGAISSAEECIARINTLKAGISKFKSNQKNITNILSEEFETCASEYYKPSENKNIEQISDEELCKILLPSLKQFIAPADSMPKYLAKRIVDNIIVNHQVPSVASVEYDKNDKEWHIRFDGADPVVLKAYKREDGNYDYEYDFEEGSLTFSSGSANESISSRNNDWDEILDEYENYINNYIRLAKKAASGDVSAVTDMASMLESAQSFSDKLEDAEGDLTEAQLSRYTKLMNKFANAASQI